MKRLRARWVVLSAAAIGAAGMSLPTQPLMGELKRLGLPICKGTVRSRARKSGQESDIASEPVSLRSGRSGIPVPANSGISG
jgi:hypothetical protein